MKIGGGSLIIQSLVEHNGSSDSSSTDVPSMWMGGVCQSSVMVVRNGNKNCTWFDVSGMERFQIIGL